MTTEAPGMPVSALVSALGPDAKLLSGEPGQTRVVSAWVWGQGPLPEGRDIAVVVTGPRNLADTLRRLPDQPSRVVVVADTTDLSAQEIADAAGDHVLIVADSDPASVVLAIAGVQHLPEKAATRRLTSLQRTLTQALADREPIPSLLNRVKSICNATAALVDKHGRAVHSTGPLPLSALFEAINHTSAPTQQFDVDGWTGVADRIHDAAQQSGHSGWLLVTARRDGFPGTYESAAVHVAAALVETSQQLAAVTRQQERAVRASVLEEALALVPMPAHPELAGRVASLGLTWNEEIRAVVIQPARQGPARGRPSIPDVAETVGRALDDAAAPHLVSLRDRFVTMLVQGSPATVRRAILIAGKSLPAVYVGVGRRVASVGEVPTSFHDAQLAVQTLYRNVRTGGFMSYEDFDFATRLFSDVGTGRMTQWAHNFLEPLRDREPLLEGLTHFFQHGQNMNAAADALSIHHNSLRYRLSKVEELLGVNLRDPSAIASVFLALAALELERTNTPVPRSTQRIMKLPPDIEAPRSVRDAAQPSSENLGVVYGPDRR